MREQHIFPAEAVALPLGTWALYEHLYAQDVVWFIDNESAAACAIRGGSNLPEVESAVQVAHLLWLHLHCRVWIEWIDSDSNPADGLSRLGFQDPWTQTQGWKLAHPGVPPWHLDGHRPDGIFRALWKDIGKRGSRTLGARMEQPISEVLAPADEAHIREDPRTRPMFRRSWLYWLPLGTMSSRRSPTA